MKSIYSDLNAVNKDLSEMAAVPGVGTLAGLSKALVGAALVVSAVAIGVFAAIPAAMMGKHDLMSHTWSLLKFGLGNVAMGLAESVPGLGTLIWIARVNAESREAPAPGRPRESLDGIADRVGSINADYVEDPNKQQAEEGASPAGSSRQQVIQDEVSKKLPASAKPREGLIRSPMITGGATAERSRGALDEIVDGVRGIIAGDMQDPDKLKLKIENLSADSSAILDKIADKAQQAENLKIRLRELLRSDPSKNRLDDAEMDKQLLEVDFSAFIKKNYPNTSKENSEKVVMNLESSVTQVKTLDKERSKQIEQYQKLDAKIKKLRDKLNKLSD